MSDTPAWVGREAIASPGVPAAADALEAALLMMPGLGPGHTRSRW